MKWFSGVTTATIEKSLPARGAWIEIETLTRSIEFVRSLPARGAWIEIYFVRDERQVSCWSLPARGAWIEIAWCRMMRSVDDRVAPREGGVD